jgi:hypothetical protein
MEKIRELFGGKFIVEKINEKGQYRVAILRIGENIFTFLESTSPESLVAKQIERFGETMQHMGIEVEDIKKFTDHLHAQGLKTSNYPEIEGVRKEVLVGPRYPAGGPWALGVGLVLTSHSPRCFRMALVTCGFSIKLMIPMIPRHFGQVRESTFPDQVGDRLLYSGSAGPNFSGIPSNFYRLPGCRGPRGLRFFFPGMDSE